MNVTTVDDLAEQLSLMQLIEPEQLQRCLKSRPGRPGDLLETLQQQGALTGFQRSRIEKGAVLGLVLGGCKLMYENAAGSFARVYRGERLRDGKVVGIKVLRDRWSDDPGTVQLFHREGEIGQQLKHENIVPIYDVGTEDGFHYFTMEFVEGGNLRDFVKIRKKLEPDEASKYVLDMCRALKYALGLHVAHRDLKLTNVLMSSQGVAKLIDFGLATDEAVLNREGGPDLQQALEYSTLEKGSGAPRNDPRSDLYFLGGIFYELISGMPPYPPTRDREERKRVGRYRNVRPVSAIEPNLPRSVTDIVDRLMHFNPAERYQTPDEVIEDLTTALRTLGAEVAHPERPEKAVSQTPTVMCVEQRVQHQDWLRDYLSRHGYRVLVLTDAERAIARLKSNPPNCVVFMGDAIGDRVLEDLDRSVMLAREKPFATVAVLTEQQYGQYAANNASTPEFAKVLSQPIKLRDLRVAIEEALGGL